MASLSSMSPRLIFKEHFRMDGQRRSHAWSKSWLRFRSLKPDYRGASTYFPVATLHLAISMNFETSLRHLASIQSSYPISLDRSMATFPPSLRQHRLAGYQLNKFGEWVQLAGRSPSELGHFGIRVVIIEPGYIAPGMQHTADHAGPDVYQELSAQWDATVDTLTGPGGR